MKTGRKPEVVVITGAGAGIGRATAARVCPRVARALGLIARNQRAP